MLRPDLNEPCGERRCCWIRFLWWLLILALVSSMACLASQHA